MLVIEKIINIYMAIRAAFIWRSVLGAINVDDFSHALSLLKGLEKYRKLLPYQFLMKAKVQYWLQLDSEAYETVILTEKSLRQNKTLSSDNKAYLDNHLISLVYYLGKEGQDISEFNCTKHFCDYSNVSSRWLSLFPGSYGDSYLTY